MTLFSGGIVASSSRILRGIVSTWLLLGLFIGAASAPEVFGQSVEVFGQSVEADAATLAAPATWPWETWQRSDTGIQRWKELDSSGITAWRQTTEALSDSIKGAVFFSVDASDSVADAQRKLESIELARLDNVVERVWWSPLKEDGDEAAGTTGLTGDAYRMPFVPRQDRLLKLTQTPTRWTIAPHDPLALAEAMVDGGVIIMDLRGEPMLNVDAEVVHAGRDGAIVLPASKAKVFGKQLQFEPLPHKNTVGYWVHADDYATWKIATKESGQYSVQILQGCGAGQGGSRIAVSVGDSSIETLVEETGHFQNFRWRDIGVVTIVPGDSIDVTVRCLQKAKAAVMDVRQIRLVPTDVKLPTDVRSVASDADLPPLSHENPAPGRRSIRKAASVEGSDAYHLLSLPTDWSPSRRYPVLVEWTGNGPYENERGDRSSGRVEDARLAYGLSGGDGWIVLSLPFVNAAGTANVSKWWGDAPDYRPDATIEYAKAAINEACDQFGGDRERLILVGFSRGSIACNAVGLANDDVAALWRGFVCFSHYDGVRPWPPTGDESASRQRLARLGNRPQLIVSESAADGSPSSLDQTRRYLESSLGDSSRIQFLETGFVNHSDAWAMRPCPARIAARQWLQSVSLPESR